MGWKKWAGLILLSLLLMPFFGIGFFVIPVYLGFKYIALLIKIDVYLAYLMIRIPIWVVQWILWHTLQVGKEIGHWFERGLAIYRQHPVGSGFAVLPSLAFMMFLVPLDIAAAASVSGVLNNVVALLTIFLGTFVLSFLLLKFFSWIGHIDLEPGAFPGSRVVNEKAKKADKAANNAAEKAGAAAAAGPGYAAQGVSMYRDIKLADHFGDKGEVSFGEAPSDVEGILENIGEEIPFLSGFTGSGAAAGGEAAAGEAAAGGAAAGAATTAGVGIFAVLVVVFILAVLAVLQAVVFAVLFGAWLHAIMPIVAGPFMAAIGLGASYGNWIGQTTQNKYLAGIGAELDEVTYVYGKARQRVFCLLRGPSCLRQWMLNNTARPGSEDVGETYGIKIDRFEVGQGSRVDIAFKEEDYALPISFTVSNPRHGLKGITAKDVEYRLKIIDSDRGREDPYCDTGWLPVGEDEVQAYEADGDGKTNDIFPGTSASTGFLTLDSVSGGDNIDLKSCEMLQPALGQFRTVILKIKYDYFSQATLYFDTMSLENLQGDPDVQKEWQESVTADTPVKAAINVNAPVIFNQGEPQPFAVRATLNTDKPDVDYRVKELTMTKSASTEIRSPKDPSCQFKNPSGNDIELKDAAKELIIFSEFDPDKQKSLPWFSANRPPPIFGCVMQLKKGAIRGISPTGETLSMGVESTYTVSKNERMGSFKVFNSRCSEFDCPLIVTVQQNMSENYPFKTSCEGIDAGNGCTIVDASNWQDVNKLNTKESIDSGDVAVEKGGTHFGLKEENWEKAHVGVGKSIHWKQDSDIKSTEEDEKGYAIIQYEDFDGKTEIAYEEIRYRLIRKKGQCAKSQFGEESEFKSKWVEEKQQELKIVANSFTPGEKVACPGNDKAWWQNILDSLPLIGGTKKCPDNGFLMWDTQAREVTCYPR